MKELAYNVYTKWGLRFFLALIFSLILRHFLILKKIVLLDAKGRWVFTNGFLQSKFQDLDRILFALLFFFFLYVLYRIDLDLTQRINSELESLITVIKEEQDSVSLTIDEFIYIKDSIEAEKTGRKQAEASEKQKDRLLKLQIAYLNHDIKTPISIIKSNSEMLQRELNDPKAKEKLRRIEGSLEDMLDLVDELQEVISSWTSKMENQIEYGLGEVSEYLIQAAKLYADSFEKTLHIKEDLAQDGKLCLDRKQFQKAFMNILENAYRYGSDDVSTSFRREKENFVIEVEDYGPGFQVQPSLAKELFFTKNTARTSRGGYGIGLFFVENCLNSHQGSMEIINKEGGEGAIVRMQLPLIKS